MMVVGLGGGLQENLLLVAASAGTQATMEQAAELDLLRDLVVPDFAFITKLVPVLTFGFAVGTAVSKVGACPEATSPLSYPTAAHHLFCCSWCYAGDV